MSCKLLLVSIIYSSPEHSAQRFEEHQLKFCLTQKHNEGRVRLFVVAMGSERQCFGASRIRVLIRNETKKGVSTFAGLPARRGLVLLQVPDRLPTRRRVGRNSHLLRGRGGFRGNVPNQWSRICQFCTSLGPAQLTSVCLRRVRSRNCDATIHSAET